MPGRQVAAWWQLHSWAALEKRARRPSDSSTVSAVKRCHMAPFAGEEAHRERGIPLLLLKNELSVSPESPGKVWWPQELAISEGLGKNEPQGMQEFFMDIPLVVCSASATLEGISKGGKPGVDQAGGGKKSLSVMGVKPLPCHTGREEEEEAAARKHCNQKSRF